MTLPPRRCHWSAPSTSRTSVARVRRLDHVATCARFTSRSAAEALHEAGSAPRGTVFEAATSRRLAGCATTVPAMSSRRAGESNDILAPDFLDFIIALNAQVQHTRKSKKVQLAVLEILLTLRATQ